MIPAYQSGKLYRIKDYVWRAVSVFPLDPIPIPYQAADQGLDTCEIVMGYPEMFRKNWKDFILFYVATLPKTDVLGVRHHIIVDDIIGTIDGRIELEELKEEDLS